MDNMSKEPRWSNQLFNDELRATFREPHVHMSRAHFLPLSRLTGHKFIVEHFEDDGEIKTGHYVDDLTWPQGTVHGDITMFNGPADGLHVHRHIQNHFDVRHVEIQFDNVSPPDWIDAQGL
jgi:hypothetical protein